MLEFWVENLIFAVCRAERLLAVSSLTKTQRTNSKLRQRDASSQDFCEAMVANDVGATGRLRTLTQVQSDWLMKLSQAVSHQYSHLKLL